MEDQPTAGQQLVKALEGAPSYLVGWLIGFVTITFTEVTMTALATACILLGFLTHSLLLAVTVYFFVYIAARIFGPIAHAIGQSGVNLAQQINQLNQILFQINTPVEVEAEEPATDNDTAQ